MVVEASVVAVVVSAATVVVSSSAKPRETHRSDTKTMPSSRILETDGVGNERCMAASGG